MLQRVTDVGWYYVPPRNALTVVEPPCRPTCTFSLLSPFFFSDKRGKTVEDCVFFGQLYKTCCYGKDKWREKQSAHIKCVTGRLEHWDLNAGDNRPHQQLSIRISTQKRKKKAGDLTKTQLQIGLKHKLDWWWNEVQVGQGTRWRNENKRGADRLGRRCNKAGKAALRGGTSAQRDYETASRHIHKIKALHILKLFRD